jgi:cephalosporin hydroxylase
MAHMMKMIEGSSIADDVIEQVYEEAKSYKTILVMLDSNHTHDHVLAELQAYAPLIAKDSYCVVWDSGVEELPDGFVSDRPWGKGDNPKTALLEYLDSLESGTVMAHDGAPMKMEIDDIIEHKIMISAASSGFLRRC